MASGTTNLTVHTPEGEVTGTQQKEDNIILILLTANIGDTTKIAKEWGFPESRSLWIGSDPKKATNGFEAANNLMRSITSYSEKDGEPPLPIEFSRLDRVNSAPAGIFQRIDSQDNKLNIGNPPCVLNSKPVAESSDINLNFNIFLNHQIAFY